MKEAEHLKEAQFDSAYQHGRTWSSRYVAVKGLPNSLESHRVGFAVGKRLGKAVVRNRLKRRLREIVRAQSLRPGWDLVFIARQEARGADFATLRTAVDEVLERGGFRAGSPSETAGA